LATGSRREMLDLFASNLASLQNKCFGHGRNKIPKSLENKDSITTEGITLKELFNEALEEKLRQPKPGDRHSEPSWMRLVGQFGKTSATRKETDRIQQVIDAEFETIEPEDR
jgi:hypothetical protein